MRRRRVKITGVGPVTPVGIGWKEFSTGIMEPVSRVTPITRFDPAAGPFIAAEIKHFKFVDHVPTNGAKRLARHTQFAMVGATLALQDAGIPPRKIDNEGTIVMTGSALMDAEVVNKSITEVTKKGPRYARPSLVTQALGSAISAGISELLGGAVRTMVFQSACCSGLDSIGFAADKIARGEADLAICGGTESPLFYHPMLELKIAGLSPSNAEMAHRMGRPFDLWRTTGIIGEGAAMLVLEPEESPRPARAYVEGFAYSNDPLGDLCGGMPTAIRLALGNAAVRPYEVDLINAWGPGHREIDAAEYAALEEVFGDRIHEVLSTSIKGAIGNPFGAAGAIQVASTVLSLESGAIPPTVNWQYRDPECPLNLSGQPRHADVACALVNAHGVSGTNSCLILRQA
jgi:3-oxoacyl-(acyl-carrier-protein) synthase